MSKFQAQNRRNVLILLTLQVWTIYRRKSLFRYQQDWSFNYRQIGWNCGITVT